MAYSVSAPPLVSFFPLSLSSSLLLSLQFSLRAVALLYYCSMEPSWFLVSINFLLIAPFIPLLNSFTKGLLSYLLPLSALLNSCTNLFIVFSPCFSFLSSATFTDSPFPPPNSFFKLIKNFSTVLYSIFPIFNSSIMFSFHMFTDPPCTYERTYWTCSSTVTSLIFILKYNLYTITNPPTLPASPLKMAGLATSIWDPMLDPIVPFSVLSASSPPVTSRACICTYITTSCSCCWWMISCKFIWLIL